MSTTAPAATWDPCGAYPARAIAAAEAPLTARTDRYMDAAAYATALAAIDELRAARRQGPGGARGGVRRRPAVAGARVLVLAGGGHNGGDALLTGALLARRGCRVTAALATRTPHPTALAAARAAGVRLSEDPVAAARAGATTAELVIDGLTGIGATGALRPAAAEVLVPLLRAGAPGRRPFRVLAVDLPSGTGVDDGTLPGPVLLADRTVTFTCLKAAHILPPAARTCGRTEVVDLGLPVPDGSPVASRPDDAGLGRLLREPQDADHKYTRGVLGVWAGSHTYPGAAVLTVSAAVRVGAGMVRLAAPERVADLVLSRRPEVVPTDGRCQALVVGPGADPTDPVRAAELDAAVGRALAAEQIPAVLDAGALGLLAARLRAGARCTDRQVLVPHAGEAAALLSALGQDTERSDVDAEPTRAARLLAELTGAVVLLKGTPTLIASPDDSAVLSLDAGPAWLATAGSGDVLAGILGGLLAGAQADVENRGGALPAASWAALAVRLHARAGWVAAGLAQTRLPGDAVPTAVPCTPPAGAGGESAPIAALDVVEAVPAAWARMRALAAGARS